VPATCCLPSLPLQELHAFAGLFCFFTEVVFHLLCASISNMVSERKKLKVQSEGSTSSEELIGQIWWTFYTKHFYYVMTADEVWITDHSIAVLMLYVMCLVEGAKGTCLVSSLL
jgi:hypothetical protein